MFRAALVAIAFVSSTAVLYALGWEAAAIAVVAIGAVYGLVLLVVGASLPPAMPQWLRGPAWARVSASASRIWGTGWLLVTLYSATWLSVVGRGGVAVAVGAIIATILLAASLGVWASAAVRAHTP